MYLQLSWHIEIGDYVLAMLDNVEVNKSVDLLADTCKIKLPAQVNNKPIPQTSLSSIGNDIQGQLKRSNPVKVWMGYNKTSEELKKTKPEFEGYLLSMETDDGSIIINCEDELFLMRKPVADKQFKATSVKQIAEYIISQLGLTMKVNCTLTINYDKFVISKATAYDVLKKLKDETKGNIYIRKNDKGEVELNIHPPYIEKHGYVDYSFQYNIENSSLKYKSKEDRKVEVIIERTGKDGKTIKGTFGTPGGEQVQIKGNGMSAADIKKAAQNEYNQRCYDGYEGDITTWLVPFAEPGYSASITDEDYGFKNGSYYVKSVTSSMDGSGGGVRKVQLGIKLSGDGQVQKIG